MNLKNCMIILANSFASPSTHASHTYTGASTRTHTHARIRMQIYTHSLICFQYTCKIMIIKNTYLISWLLKSIKNRLEKNKHKIKTKEIKSFKYMLLHRVQTFSGIKNKQVYFNRH